MWSPGGERLGFRSNRNGLTELYQKSASAGGSDQPLLLEDAARTSLIVASNLIATDWSSDGEYLALAANAPSDIWLMKVKDNTLSRVVGSLGDQMHGNYSPDGRFIADTSNESGRRYDVYVETLPTSDRKWPISTDGGYEPR